jgi:hypothetical protein
MILRERGAFVDMRLYLPAEIMKNHRQEPWFSGIGA